MRVCCAIWKTERVGRRDWSLGTRCPRRSSYCRKRSGCTVARLLGGINIAPPPIPAMATFAHIAAKENTPAILCFQLALMEIAFPHTAHVLIVNGPRKGRGEVAHGSLSQSSPCRDPPLLCRGGNSEAFQQAQKHCPRLDQTRTAAHRWA